MVAAGRRISLFCQVAACVRLTPEYRAGPPNPEASVTQRRIYRLAFRHLVTGLGCLPATACGAGWHAVAVAEPVTLAPRQQAQIWVGHRQVRVHGVAVTQDSISGIPFLQSLACDSCRLSFPRAQVDSLRVGDPTGGFWGSTGLVLLGLLLAAFAVCTTSSVDCTGRT